MGRREELVAAVEAAKAGVDAAFGEYKRLSLLHQMGGEPPFVRAANLRWADAMERHLSAKIALEDEDARAAARARAASECAHWTNNIDRREYIEAAVAAA